MNKINQQTKVLNIIKSYPSKHFGKPVPNYYFTRLGILRYSSRIAELRKDGHRITIHRDWSNGHATGVYRYRLDDEA